MIKPTYYRSFKRILFEYLFEWYLKKEATKDGNFVIFTLLINSVWCVSYPSGYVSRTIMIRLTACNSSTRKHGWSNLHSKCLIWMEITMLLYQKKWLQSQKMELENGCWLVHIMLYPDSLCIYIYTQTIGVAKLDITNYRDLPSSVTTIDLVPLWENLMTIALATLIIYHSCFFGKKNTVFEVFFQKEQPLKYII